MRKLALSDEILLSISSPARYIGNEINAVMKDKSEFVERFPELSLFFKAFSPLDSEMICIFPYFCPCEIIVREIREISI